MVGIVELTLTRPKGLACRTGLLGNYYWAITLLLSVGRGGESIVAVGGCYQPVWPCCLCGPSRAAAVGVSGRWDECWSNIVYHFARPEPLDKVIYTGHGPFKLQLFVAALSQDNLYRITCEYTSVLRHLYVISNAICSCHSSEDV